MSWANPPKRLKAPRLTCPVVLLLINAAPRNIDFAQDVVGQIHPWFNSTIDRVYARKGVEIITLRVKDWQMLNVSRCGFGIIDIELFLTLLCRIM